MPEGVVFAGFVSYQFLVATLLDDTALVEDQNIIIEAGEGQVVGYINGSLVFGDFIFLFIFIKQSKNASSTPCRLAHRRWTHRLRH